MEKTIITLVATSLLLASTGSFAEKTDAIPPKGHFYGQAELGLTTFDIAPGFLSAQTQENSKMSYALRGGYEFPSNTTFHLGVEGGYLYLGKSNFQNVFYFPANAEFKQQGFDLLLVAKKEINPAFNLFAKGGFAVVNQSISVSAPMAYYSGELNTTETAPEIAAGIGIKINQNVLITGTVSHIFGDRINHETTTDQIGSSSSASIGLRADID